MSGAIRLKKLFNENIVAFMRVTSFRVNGFNRNLVRCNCVEGSYVPLRKNNYVNYLPLYCAKRWGKIKNWWEIGTIFTTSDGGDAFMNDKQFLKSCLLFVVLDYGNRCLSFMGSDGRYYRNELCLDVSNGRTIAAVDLDEMLVDCPLDDEEQELLDLWFAVLKEAGKTDNYNPSLTYGVYQITRELNTSHKENGKVVYDYPQLNNALRALRKADKKYWETHIREKLFRYELLK